MNALITGGVGFIGTNLAKRLLNLDWNVVIFDSFIRSNVEKNARFIKNYAKSKGLASKLKIIRADVRDYQKVLGSVNKQDVIFHLAAQVAVTTSIDDPVSDFETNIKGTLNVLEAARKQKNPPIVIYSSTNKVYGQLEGIGKPISENQILDFHSPYGVSKGCADSYVHDYARIYNLPTVVFRQSCIYGPMQYGVEDQGWIAHFAIQALKNNPITIFGDGGQVRDLLYVDDLIDAYLIAFEKIDKSRGQIFNIGGGDKNALSLLQSIKILEKKLNTKIILKFDKKRPGDQKYFVSNNQKLKKVLGFKVKTRYSDGLEKLILWLKKQNLK